MMHNWWLSRVQKDLNDFPISTTHMRYEAPCCPHQLRKGDKYSYTNGVVSDGTATRSRGVCDCGIMYMLYQQLQCFPNEIFRPYMRSISTAGQGRDAETGDGDDAASAMPYAHRAYPASRPRLRIHRVM
jgi:hypothetical protein